MFTLDGVAPLCNTVPVDEVVDEAVEVDDEVGKWLSKAHNSPNIASGKNYHTVLKIENRHTYIQKQIKDQF